MGGCLNPTPDPERDPYPVWSTAQPVSDTPAPGLQSWSPHTPRRCVPFLNCRMHSLCSGLESPDSDWVPEARNLPLFFDVRFFSLLVYCFPGCSFFI